LENKPASLAQADDLFHALRVRRLAHYLGHRLTQITQIQRREFCSGGCVSRIAYTPQATRVPLQHPAYPQLRLRFHCHLGLH
jgi:hypothetical protein